MATDAFGAAADHGGLAGLTSGDPHTQYAAHSQGLFSARPAQPVRAGYRYYATDAKVEYISTGSTWELSVNKAVIDALGINATQLNGVGPTGYLRGFDGNTGQTVFQSYVLNGAETDWRRVAVVQMPTPAASGADYTGGTWMMRVWDGYNSWGQIAPANPLNIQIAITNSNVATTSNAQTATITGQWSGYDYVRVVKLANYAWEIQVRPSGQYYALFVECRQMSMSGAGTTTYDAQYPLPSPAQAGTAQYYLASSSNYNSGDSRGWINATYQNGWTTYGASYGPARYRRIGGVVYLDGLVMNGTVGSVIFTLPAGYRPSTQRLGLANTSTGPGRVDVLTDGTVQMYTGSNAWVSLSNIVFPAEA